MLSRRQFFSLVARGVAAELLLPFLDPALQAELQDEQVYLKKRIARTNRSYGSGAFGEWIPDANGLPCYHYTCVQTDDPFAVTPVEAAWRASTDHTHQVGNDRITAAVSNYGYVQVRQDEGGPRFLNDYLPREGLYGAGLGYLTDGKEVLGTYFPGTGVSFERFFGIGYLRKQSTGTNFSIDQAIYAPFGDDPVLISEVTISSQAPDPANLSWTEYWGCQHYPFSYQALLDGEVEGQLDPEQVAALRREQASRFSHRFEKTPDGAGLIETKSLHDRSLPRTGTAIQEESDDDAAIVPRAFAPRAESSRVEAADVPPPCFLASLNQGPVRLLTRAAEFFGAAAVPDAAPTSPEKVPVPRQLLRPASLGQAAPANAVAADAPADDLSATGAESALILQQLFTLEPGQSTTLRFVYGYLPQGFSAARLIAKYRDEPAELLARSSQSWKDEALQLVVKEDPWVERETLWHHYYLRSGLSFDGFFSEHILSQGQVYQYCMGYQGAARDPLQHALPLIFGEASLAKQVLRYMLKSQAADGRLPYAVTARGQAVPSPSSASDLDLWLLWVASEYVLATRDGAFLEEKLPSDSARPGSGPVTVREKLQRAYRHLVETIGTGKHGLLRGLDADWNDLIYRQSAPESQAEEVRRESESVSNAAMASYVFEHYARMLRYAPSPGSAASAIAAQDAVNRAGQQRAAVRAQWSGRWFKRLWLGPAAGWAGEDRMWLEVQPWAVLGGCASGEQAQTLVRSIDELLRKPSRIGAKQVGFPAGSKPIDWPGFMPGETKNGGVYADLGGALIWALAGIDGAAASGMAYDEWKKNSRANHAEIYPNVWYGIWSGPDVYCSSDSDHAGQTGYDWGLIDLEALHRPSKYRGLSWTAWPVMNMHRHAWPLYSAAKLMGIEFTEKGIDLAPVVPKPEYSFHSRLVGLEKSTHGYAGWYFPQKPGEWTVRLKLPPDETSLKKLTVNGSSQSPLPQGENTIQFTGTSTGKEALRWSLDKG